MPEEWRLLRVLFVRFGQVSTPATATGLLKLRCVTAASAAAAAYALVASCMWSRSITRRGYI
jgi:hypothetical protein